MSENASVSKETTVTMPDGTTRYKCQYCGKLITRDQTIEQEAGDYCQHLRDQGLDTTALAEIRSGKTVEEVPVTDGEPWIKTAVLHKICQKNSIPVSAMVRAFGGDRGLGEPLHPKFVFVYVGRARYVDPWCATPEGLKFLRTVARTPTSESTAKALSSGSKTRKSVKAPKEAEAILEEVSV